MYLILLKKKINSFLYLISDYKAPTILLARGWDLSEKKKKVQNFVKKYFLYSSKKNRNEKIFSPLLNKISNRNIDFCCCWNMHKNFAPARKKKSCPTKHPGLPQDKNDRLPSVLTIIMHSKCKRKSWQQSYTFRRLINKNC